MGPWEMVINLRDAHFMNGRMHHLFTTGHIWELILPEVICDFNRVFTVV